MVKKLIAAGADVNKARTLGNPDANPNAQQSNDLTPLYTAANLGHTEIVATLLQHGADRSIRGNALLIETPLEVAERKNHRDIIALLLEQESFIGRLLGGNVASFHLFGYELSFIEFLGVILTPAAIVLTILLFGRKGKKKLQQKKKKKKIISRKKKKKKTKTKS